MATCFDEKSGLNLLSKVPSELSDELFAELTNCIDVSQPGEEYSLFLSQLSARLFANSILAPCHRLLLYATEHAPANLWLEILLLRLQAATSEYLPLLLDLLSRFFVSFNRLAQLYQCFLDQANSVTLKTRPQFLVELLRPVINLPTLVSNKSKLSHSSRLFTPQVYLRLLLQKIPRNRAFHLLSGVMISTSCFLGHGTEIWNFILQQIARSGEVVEFWSAAMCNLPERTLEATLVPLLATASHPALISLCLRQCFEKEAPQLLTDQLFRLFHRLLFVRMFPSSPIPVNIFGGLFEIFTTLKEPERKAIFKRVNKDLGLPLLHTWSNKTALNNTSSAQRIYLNQSLVTWVACFRNRIPLETNDEPNESIVADVLTGITAHLSCNLEEQRIVGMAVGEWLIRQFNIGLKAGNDGDDATGKFLKFQFDANSAVKSIQPLFEPPPPYQHADLISGNYFSSFIKFDKL